MQHAHATLSTTVLAPCRRFGTHTRDFLQLLSNYIRFFLRHLGRTPQKEEEEEEEEEEVVAAH